MKFGAENLATAAGRARLVVGLAKKHSGELVELDSRRSGWQLRAAVPGSASATLPAGAFTQWLRRQGGGPAGRMEFQFGYPGGLLDVRRSMRCEVMDMVKQRGIDALDLAPDWRSQITRVRAPCRGTDEFEWHRTGLVVSLGELMRALGKQFSAKQM